MLFSVNTQFGLVRHGDPFNPDNILYSRREGHPLLPIGREKIGKTADKLVEIGIQPSAIYRSPQERATSSAEELGRRFPGVPIIEDPRLNEVDAGDLTGYSLEYIMSQGGDQYRMRQGPSCKEQPVEIVSRVLNFLSEKTEEHTGGTFLVVGHADPHVFALQKLLNPYEEIPPSEQIKQANRYLDMAEAAIVLVNQHLQVTRLEFLRHQQGYVVREAYQLPYAYVEGGNIRRRL